eukprot:Clim_evm14s70 gene=Clim_evmTU14s70
MDKREGDGTGDVLTIIESFIDRWSEQVLGDDELNAKKASRLLGRDPLVIARRLRLLSKIYNLAQHQEKMSLRGLKYACVDLYQGIRDVMHCFMIDLKVLSGHLGINRVQFGVIPAAKGFLTGSIALKTLSATKEACLINQTMSVDHEVATAEFRSIGAQFILVVEKAAVFEQLLDHAILHYCPMVLMTGCGRPSEAMGQTLTGMQAQLALPAYLLSDYNPYGLSIVMDYMLGCRANRPIGWIGLTDEQLTRFPMDSAMFTEFTSRDTKVMSTIMKRAPGVLACPSIADTTLMRMKCGRRKLDIDVIVDQWGQFFIQDLIFRMKMGLAHMRRDMVYL